MTEDAYSKVAQIADELLGKEDMHKYPLLLVIGLLCIAFTLRKHRPYAVSRMPQATARRSMTHPRLATDPRSR